MSGPSFLCESMPRCLVLPLDWRGEVPESPLKSKVSSQMAPVRVDGRFAFENPQVDRLTFYGLLWQV